MVSLQAEVDAGQDAQRIIDNPMWGKLHESWREDLMRQLLRVAGSPEQCQQVAFLLMAGDKFRQHVETIAQTGVLAQIELDKSHTQG